MLSPCNKEMYSECDLWKIFRQGDKKAFARLYEVCFRKLYTYGSYLGMDELQIEDAIHDIFLKLYEKPAIITDASTLLPFLFRSVRNYFLNSQKRENRQTGINEETSTFSFEYTIEDHLIVEEDKQLLTKQIEEIMSCLTPHQKEIIYFRFFHEMTYSEIANVLNISHQVAKNILYRAFEKIRRIYPPTHPPTHPPTP